jgi:cytochrome c oxidase subunit 2
MNLRSPLAMAILMTVAPFVHAEERIIAAAAHAPGANGTFWRTELRLFNPSATEIEIEASLLPELAAPIAIRVPAFGKVRHDDALDALFGARGLAAIRLRSDDAFEATSRTFTSGGCGSFGQFVPSMNVEAALQRGLLLHLGDDVASRTNIGFANTNDAPATVTLRSSGHAPRTLVVPARALLQTSHLGSAIVAFEADRPVFGYGSVVDNESGDASFVAAVADRSEPAVVFDIEARQFQFTVTPGGAETIHVRRGDRVTLRLRSIDALHGFIMPNVLAHRTLIGGAAPIEVTFVADHVGTFPFFCTIECGSGHHGMAGQMEVTP